MKTQTISQNTHLFLQSHPQEANTCRESFEILQNYLQRTVNLLGQRLFDLTKNRADLTEIGKAQRALTGAMNDFHKTLGFLSDIQDIEPEVLYDPLARALPRESTQNPPPEHGTTTVDPIEPPCEPQTDPAPAPPENTQNKSEPAPPEPVLKPLDPDHDPAEDLPPLDPFADNFEEVADLYEAKLKAAIAQLQSPSEESPDPGDPPHSPEKTNPIRKIDPPKKYNTRRKRKNHKYLRKLQKRHATKAAA